MEKHKEIKSKGEGKKEKCGVLVHFWWLDLISGCFFYGWSPFSFSLLSRPLYYQMNKISKSKHKDFKQLAGYNDNVCIKHLKYLK